MRGTAQRGFTLVELLVVIGIIATLAAVAIPAVGRLVAPARVAAKDQESGRVQEAMDTYIAENHFATVTPNNTATRDFESSTPQLYPNYMRDPTSLCEYTWDTYGQMTVGDCD